MNYRISERHARPCCTGSGTSLLPDLSSYYSEYKMLYFPGNYAADLGEYLVQFTWLGVVMWGRVPRCSTLPDVNCMVFHPILSCFHYYLICLYFEFIQ